MKAELLYSLVSNEQDFSTYRSRGEKPDKLSKFEVDPGSSRAAKECTMEFKQLQAGCVALHRKVSMPIIYGKGRTWSSQAEAG